MAIAYVSNGGYNSSATTSLGLTAPASIVAGDLLICFICVEDNAGSSTINTLSGWTLIYVQAGSQDGYYHNFYAFYKVAGGSEPGTYTWTANNGGTFIGMDGDIRQYSGTATSVPIINYATGVASTGSFTLVVPTFSGNETFVSGEWYVTCMADLFNYLPSSTTPTLSNVYSNAGVYDSLYMGDYVPGSVPGTFSYNGLSGGYNTVAIGFTILPATAGDTPAHTLGRFTPTSYRRFPYNYEGSDLPQVVETQPHTLGRFTPTVYRRFPYNYEGSDLPQVVETQPHTLGRFTPSAFNLLPALRQNQDIVGAAAVVETQPHTLGRFTPSAFNLLPALRQNQDIVGAAAVVVPETNVHWIGKYTSTQYALLVNLRQNQDSVSPGSFVAETNVHTLGRFAPTQYAVFQNSGLWQNQDRVFPGSFVAETNPHWLGHFTPTLFPLVQTLGWRSNSDTFGPPGPTGPPPFYGHKFVGHDVGLLM